MEAMFLPWMLQSGLYYLNKLRVSGIKYNDSFFYHLKTLFVEKYRRKISAKILTRVWHFSDIKSYDYPIFKKQMKNLKFIHSGANVEMKCKWRKRKKSKIVACLHEGIIPWHIPQKVCEFLSMFKAFRTKSIIPKSLHIILLLRKCKEE